MVSQPRRGPAAALVMAALAFIAIMTLRPAASGVSLSGFCIFCGQLGGVDFALNIALFVPLGLGLRWFLRQWKSSSFIGAAVSLVVESLQWRLIPGRDASFGDLLANTLGTMLGAWLAIEGLRWLSASSGPARRLAATFGIIAATIIGASAWLLRPVSPAHFQYVQVTPRRPNLDPFQGRLVAVELNGRPLLPADIVPAQWTTDTVTGSLSLRAVLEAPVPPTRRQAIIVRILSNREEGFSLGQWGTSATFRTHVAAARLKLRPILLGFEGALSEPTSTAGRTETEFTIEAVSSRRAMTLKTERPGSGAMVTLPRTVGLAWALLLPWDVALGPTWWLANACWLGLLMLPVVFFTARSRDTANNHAGRGIAWWPLPLVLASIVAAPGAAGMSALGLGEWLGVLTGTAAGLALERLTAAREPTDPRAGARSDTRRP